MTGSFSSSRQRAKIVQVGSKTGKLPPGSPPSLQDSDFTEKYTGILRSIVNKRTKKALKEESRKPQTLPIVRYLPKIGRYVRQRGLVIVNASMGSGKTTKIPPYLHSRGYKVETSQPRRFPAVSTHKRLESQMGGKNGEIVGLKHSLGGTRHPDPPVRVVTDGIFLKKMFSLYKQPANKKFVGMLDELHEYNLNMEATLALIKMGRDAGNQLQMVFSSGSIDTRELVRYFGKKTPVVQVPTTFKNVYKIEKGESLASDIVQQVSLGRDTLVFLPGKRQIRQLKEQLEKLNISAVVLPLHSQLSATEQDLVHRKYDRPKVVLATNIAQTSVTIEGMKTVIITGYQKRITVEGEMEVLTIAPISQPDFLQQMWRVGRIEDGYCINWGPDFEKLPKRPAYPIQNSLLDDLCLQFLMHGIDPETVQFLHQPREEAFDLAIKKLQRLGLVGNKKHLLPAAYEIAELPLELRPRKFVSEAIARSRGSSTVKNAAIIIGSLIEADGVANGGERSKWGRLLGPIKDLAATSDLFTEWYLFSRIEKIPEPHRRSFCKKHGLSFENFSAALEVRGELARRTKVEIAPTDFSLVTPQEIEILLKAIWEGWSDYVFRRTSGRSQRDSMYKPVFDKKGKAAMISRSSTVEAAPLLIGRPFGIMEDIDATHEENIKRLLCHVTKVPISWLEENRQSFDATLSNDTIKKIRARERRETSREKKRER
jgi:HrpA-like RNA helicase